MTDAEKNLIDVVMCHGPTSPSLKEARRAVALERISPDVITQAKQAFIDHLRAQKRWENVEAKLKLLGLDFTSEEFGALSDEAFPK